MSEQEQEPPVLFAARDLGYEALAQLARLQERLAALEARVAALTPGRRYLWSQMEDLLDNQRDWNAAQDANLIELSDRLARLEEQPSA